MTPLSDDHRGGALDGLPEALRAALPSPLTPVADERFAARGLELLLKRDDLLHPALPGNKWRKLVPNLLAARRRGDEALLTFGGAYSNHLRATAAAGRLLGLATVGVVRGEELAGRPLNDALTRCAADGMRLHFVSRSEYRERADPAYRAGLCERLGLPPGTLVVPEGGSNDRAVHGCVALGRELRGAADVAAVACGTGGTLAGLAAEGPPAIGVPVLAGGFLGGEVSRLQREAFGGPRGTWRLEERFHCGGYARGTPALEAFARDFEARHGLAVERVYVAKALYAVTTLAAEGAFAAGSRIAVVVTG
ncbi:MULTISPECIES: 1-aminocyclopropane-1-carboxylate deaminase/D-cysteine desulfhydrase [unclassified Streptomyces]|uniref:1-aminocyclopropane-1-carboxylate deaminase/D-cysteine desulfhydrase n=1 Tax=unclassified Streptomyces TaxID=2593676 RepID=UPI0022B66E36|nr:MULTISPECIES: pyridoxal-phosphate dependent enzyme [unclassified Streptomyces]MCZ7416606.1 pyridoxal-phosphate dependent enzyme [Streptomyces sp. WMMC897]MCZ7433581.1 pyridoxal-phosphate dependent enzyme [Streptomyces sp. WMMC1477]